MSKLNNFFDANADKLFDDNFIFENFGYYPYADDSFNKDNQDDIECEKQPTQTTSSSSTCDTLNLLPPISQETFSSTFGVEEAPTQTFIPEKASMSSASSYSSSSSATSAYGDEFNYFGSTHIINPDEIDGMLYTDNVTDNADNADNAFWTTNLYDNYETNNFMAYNQMNNNYINEYIENEDYYNDEEVDEEDEDEDTSEDDEEEEDEDDEEESEDDDDDDDDEKSKYDNGIYGENNFDIINNFDAHYMDTEPIEINAEEVATQKIQQESDTSSIIEVRAPSMQNDEFYASGLQYDGISSTYTLSNIQNDFVNQPEIEKYKKHSQEQRRSHKKSKGRPRKTTSTNDASSTATILVSEDIEKLYDENDIDYYEKETGPNSSKKASSKKQSSKARTKTKNQGNLKKVLGELEVSQSKVCDDSERLKSVPTNLLLSKPKSSKRGRKPNKSKYLNLPQRRLSAVVAEANATVEKTRNSLNLEYVYVKPSVYTDAKERSAFKVGKYDAGEYDEYVKKLSDEVVASKSFVSPGLFVRDSKSSAEAPIAVVESYSCNIARSIFVYPPRTHQSLEIQRPEKPIEDKFPVIKPAAVHVGKGDVDYLLASALIVRRLKSNRIVLHKVTHDEKRYGNEWEVRDISGCATGFTFKTRVADIKWLTTKILAVANGCMVKVVSLRSAKPLPSITAQRTSLYESSCEWASHSNSSEIFFEGNIIREIDSKRSSPGEIFTGTESGSVMLYDIISSGNMRRVLPSTRGSSPVSSVRSNGLPEYVHSFTTDSGNLCLVDKRMPWNKPSFCVNTNALVGDKYSSLWTHDWNPAVPGEVVLGYASKAVGTMAGLDIRFPACILHAKDYRSSVLPFDIHFADNCTRNYFGDIKPPQSSPAGNWRNSNFALFGERNFAIGNLHSNFDWFTPSAEKEFNANQVCVMGCFLERDALLTVSDNADLKIWSLLNM